MDVRPIDANALAKKARAYPDFMAMIGKAPTLSINTLRDEIYADAVAHGLWSRKDYPSDCAWLIKEEAVELCEAGNDWEDEGWYEGEENAQYSDELADVIIMSLSVAGHLSIDIDAAVRAKMEVNKNRPWKHGK